MALVPSDKFKKAPPESKKIMVLDDDDSILQLVRATLEGEGFQVRTGRDGHNVLKKVLEYRPDMIICDLMMPGGGGYEVIRSLQSDDLTRKIPVLLITGYNLDPSTKNMIQQESNLVSYFEKPVRQEKIVRKVHEVLNTLSRDEQRAQNSKPPEFGDFGGGMV